LDGQVKSNAALFFVGLKPFGERYSSDNIKAQTAQAIIAQASEAFSTVREGIILAINPPSIPGLGTTGGLELYVQSKGDSGLDQTATVIADFVAKANQRPELTGVTSTFDASSQQLLASVDREKSEILGVPVDDVY